MALAGCSCSCGGSTPGGEPSTSGRVLTRPRVSERTGFALASCPVASCPETRARAAQGPRSAPRRGGRGAGAARWLLGERAQGDADRERLRFACGEAALQAAAADETVQK